MLTLLRSLRSLPCSLCAAPLTHLLTCGNLGYHGAEVEQAPRGNSMRHQHLYKRVFTKAWPTDRPTDRQTDKPSYRDAMTHLKSDLCTMVSDVPTSEQTSERSGAKRASAWVEHGRVNEWANGGLRSRWVSERVALLNDAVFCIIDHSDRLEFKARWKRLIFILASVEFLSSVMPSDGGFIFWRFFFYVR